MESVHPSISGAISNLKGNSGQDNTETQKHRPSSPSKVILTGSNKKEGSRRHIEPTPFWTAEAQTTLNLAEARRIYNDKYLVSGSLDPDFLFNVGRQLETATKFSSISPQETSLARVARLRADSRLHEELFFTAQRKAQQSLSFTSKRTGSIQPVRVPKAAVSSLNFGKHIGPCPDLQAPDQDLIKFLRLWTSAQLWLQDTLRYSTAEATQANHAEFTEPQNPDSLNLHGAELRATILHHLPRITHFRAEIILQR